MMAGASTVSGPLPSAPVERRRGRRIAVIVIAFVVTAVGAVTAYVATREHSPTDDVPSVIAPAPLAHRITAIDAGLAAIEPDAAMVETTPLDASTVAEGSGSSAVPGVVAVRPVAPRLGTVVVTLVGVPHGQIQIDGHVVAARAAGASVELTGGEHDIRVSVAGHFPASKHVRVVAGAKQQIEITPVSDPNAVHSPYGDD